MSENDMIERFGKQLNMKSLNRDLDKIRRYGEEGRNNCAKYFLSQASDNVCCRICGSDDTKHFIKMNSQSSFSYDYNICNRCGSVFLKNLPDIKKMYTTEDASANLPEYISKDIYERRIEMISAPKVNFVLDTCRHEGVDPKNWLDIGCGGGEILSFLKANTEIKGMGIESDPKELAFARTLNLDIYDGFIDVENENLEISQLLHQHDVVSMINVLEHVEDPAKLVDYLCNQMHDDALFVVEVPRHPSVAAFANQTYDSLIYRHIVPPIHLQIFSEKSLDMLLGDRFDILGKWRYGQGFTDLINYAAIQSEPENMELYDLIMQKSNEIQKTVDEAGLADVILLVARKRAAH